MAKFKAIIFDKYKPIIEMINFYIIAITLLINASLAVTSIIVQGNMLNYLHIFLSLPDVVDDIRDS